MEVKEKYIQKYWHEIVRDQITDELKEQGFEVYSEYDVDGFTADLFAEKGDEKRIIEIKKNALTRDAFIKLHGFALKRGIKFQLAIADFRSLKPSIEIDNIELMLTNYMNEHHLYEDFAHNSSVDDVTDVSYSKIEMDEDAISLQGNAVCDMLIQMDNEGDCDFNNNFPMTFDIKINTKTWEIEDSEDGIEVDTSSFYE